jgi:hypothetical protein
MEQKSNEALAEAKKRHKTLLQKMLSLKEEQLRMEATINEYKAEHKWSRKWRLEASESMILARDELNELAQELGACGAHEELFEIDMDI